MRVQFTRVQFTVDGYYDLPDYEFPPGTHESDVREVAEETVMDCLSEALGDYDSSIHVTNTNVRAV